MKRLELTVQRFCYAQSYGRDFQIAVDEQWLRRAMTDAHERQLVHYVYGRAHTAEYSHPADWWQAFRARWFPRWWLKRHPVHMEVVRFDAKALIPEIAVLADRYVVAYHGELSPWEFGP